MKSWLLFILLVWALLLAAPTLRAQEFHGRDTASGLDRPLSFDRLTIWIIKGSDRFEHAYMTIEQALSSGRAVLYNENSQTLRVENRSDTDLFLEAGDLIRGGQQDRMIADDRILAAHDSASDLDVFCIEQGRSTARGAEPLSTFSGSHWIAPLAHTRLVARANLTERLLTPEVGGLTAPDSSQLELLESLQNVPERFGYVDPAQESVWNDVTQMQRELTRSLKDSVTKNASPTSMELALENSSLADRERAFAEHFADAANRDARAVGFVYAIDGTLTGAEQYATHDLFVAMWPKLLRSIAAAAIASHLSVSNPVVPAIESVRSFVAAPGIATSSQAINARTLVEAAKTEYGTRFVTWDKTFPNAPLHVEWIAR